MNAEAQVAVACHELIHVRRRDWLITIVEETYASLVWFHPAIWWLIAQARLSCEQLVDARVVGITDDREPYIHALLQIAGARPSLDLAPASLFLRRRHLAHRMHSLTTEALPMSKRQLFVSCISMLLILAVAGWGAIVSFPLTALAEAPPAEVQDDGFVVRQNATVYYPREAIETGLEGEVVVELTFNTGGTIVDSRVLSGPDALRRAAIQTAIGGTYTVTGNRTLQVIVEFALENIPTGVAGGRGLRGGPAGAPPPPPPPPPAPGDRLRVSAGVSSANLIQQVPPVYPPLARQARIQGLVIVEATIDPAGNVSSARVVSGHPLLAAAAVEAVLQWKYRPTLLNGAPIAVVTTANVTFSLRPE
jgi:TonB family protein